LLKFEALPQAAPRPIMDTEVFRFADCELIVATRELRLRGTPQALERRALDLLIYLIRHRHRVVGKDELLLAVWGRNCVTNGVIASAVMKVRKAIDDKLGALVRTLHGTGYRFVGEATDLHAANQAPAPAAVDGPERKASLVLLPIDNQTGDPDLAWVEVGLLRLVAGALARDGRLEQPSSPSMLSMIATLPQDASPQERAAVATRLLGATDVAHAVLRRHDEGYALSCGFIVGGRPEPLVLQASEPIEFGLGLARALASAMLPDGPRPCVEFESTDVATNVTLARAMQAAAEHDWQRARSLLAAVVESQPDHMTAAVEYLRALIALDDCEAFKRGEPLLNKARQAASVDVEAEIHLQLAQAYARRRLNDDAQRHLDSALYLTPGRESHDWVLTTTLARACVATAQCDFPVASALLDRAESLCAQGGDVFQQIKTISQRIVLLAETGNMRLAWPFANQVVALHRTHGILAGLARAESTLANVSATLGRWQLAEQHCLAAVAIAREQKSPSDLAVGLTVLCGIYRQLRKPQSLARALEALDEVDASGAPVNRLLGLLCRAQHALALDQPAVAARLLQEAASGAGQACQVLEKHFVLPLLAGALVHAGSDTQAQETCRQMEESATRRNRTLDRARLHCEAQLALALGDRSGALERLLEVRRLGAGDWWSSMASLDAAWLTVEQGDCSAAEQLLDGMGQWLEEHPVGLATQARLLHAQGRHAEALQTHQRLDDLMEGDGPRYWAELRAAYAADEAHASTERLPLPPAPRLPTWI
jgi:DNA-binding winged helix-turn-helix (wHTH) protein/tetratricopeptide (TPR) repeat protein